MDWQTEADVTPSRFITTASMGELSILPPATGAWRDGDVAGNREFVSIGSLTLESGQSLHNARIAYESWGQLSPERDNAILILHALTGDSHVTGSQEPGHRTHGWWSDVVGPGRAIDTDRWFVVAPNVLGGCQGSTGPASLAPDGREYARRFPYVTIRDQVRAQREFSDRLGIQRWAAAIGGSMGGMHALEWGVSEPDRVERIAVIAAPPRTTADQIALNAVQLEAIRSDAQFHGGDYYDEAAGAGPARGLALARRMALLNYRTAGELNDRFERSWQSDMSPLGEGGRFAVESYLDFHGNKFTRRFDANSYLTLTESMNSHDIGRGRGGIAAALKRVRASTLVLGIDSDRYFPLDGQREIAAGLDTSVTGPEPFVISSEYGHDAFLIEHSVVGEQINALLNGSGAAPL